MKKLIITFLFFCLLMSQNFAEGQTTSADVHIILNPNQKKEPIQIDTSCLILLRNYSIRMTILLGNSYEMMLPKGTKYLVGKGNYHLENPMNSVLEFELVSADKCQR